MAFLFLIDYAARLLRPVSIVQRVGGFGVGVIQSVYPRPTTGTRPAVSVVRPGQRSGSSCTRALPASSSPSASPASAAGTRRRRHRRIRSPGRRLRRDEEPLFRLHGGAADRGPGAARARGVRQRAHDGAGPDLRPSDPCRHRDQGVVAGDQRSDHRRDGAGSDAPPAARRWHAPPADEVARDAAASSG